MPWRRLTPAEHKAVDNDVQAFPLPNVDGAVSVDWEQRRNAASALAGIGSRAASWSG